MKLFWRVRRRSVQIGLTLVGVLAIACGEGSGSGPVEPLPPKTGLIGISVSPVGASVAVGDTVHFLAVVTTDDPTHDTTVLWQSSHPNIAQVDSLRGVVRGIAPGLATVIATARIDANFKAAVQVTVIQ